MQTLAVIKLTSRCQATIPGRVRQMLRLKPGDSVVFKFRAGQVYLEKTCPIDRVFARAVGKVVHDEWSSGHDERAYRNL